MYQFKNSPNMVEILSNVRRELVLILGLEWLGYQDP